MHLDESERRSSQFWHNLAEARVDTVLDDVYEIVACYLDINIESIDIFEVFVNSTCLFEIANLIMSPVWLIVVVIVLSNGVCDLLPRSLPVPSSLPPFQ